MEERMSDLNPFASDLLVRLREVSSAIASHEVEFALVGGLAVSVWGEARMTYDIDFVVASTAADVARLRSTIEASDVFPFEPEELVLQKLSILRALVPTSDRSDVIMVDFLCVDPEFARSLLDRRVIVPFAGEQLPVASPEDLLVLKLQSGRVKDLEDAKSVIRKQSSDLDRSYIQTWVDRFELRAVAQEVGLEFE